MNSSIKKDKGFTIIEVVLVLAIAGLIFLVVFLALPALQRSQRDSQRRSDVGRFIAAVQSHKTNHNGSTPIQTNATTGLMTSWGTLVADYMDNNFIDPTTSSTYTIASTAVPTVVGTISAYRTAATDPCASTVVASNTGTKWAVRIALETGGSYCQVL